MEEHSFPRDLWERRKSLWLAVTAQTPAESFLQVSLFLRRSLCKGGQRSLEFFFFLKSFSKDFSGSHLTEGRLATLWQKLVYGRYLWPRSTLIVMAA